ncbi:hypothetical protein ACH4C6_10295 [Streptomyces sp. NPDC017943]|uniref:hypothetical protein n=1 Tax=Streptomyces sp. NPDC017943 TaxID=3365019 RepID=UPI0037BD9561
MSHPDRPGARLPTPRPGPRATPAATRPAALWAAALLALFLAVVPGAASPAPAAQPTGVRLVPSAGVQAPPPAEERPGPAGGSAVEGPGAAHAARPYAPDGCATACAVHAVFRLEPLGERTPPPGHPAAVAGREAPAVAATGPPAAATTPQGQPRADHASTDRGRSPPVSSGT